MLRSTAYGGPMSKLIVDVLPRQSKRFLLVLFVMASARVKDRSDMEVAQPLSL